jgi:tyramine---L-glutamate ligase
MRDALLRDLETLARFDITTMLDARLKLSPLTRKSIMVNADDDFNKVFKKALKQADYVWLIAPETEGILLQLTEICLAAEDKENGMILLGCGYDSTLIGTSKTLSFEALQAANIHTLPVYAAEDLIQQEYFDAVPNHAAKWVAKPEDGAGCEGIRLFENLHALRDWLRLDDQYLHYQQGITASLSAVFRDGKGWLLSCNTQHIQCVDSQFKLKGISVNGMQAYWQRFETLARKIAKMLPDALGYMGVDVIVDTENDKIYVIDINPRLTSSYVALHNAIGHNPAKIIVDCILEQHFKMPVLQKNIVEIML